MPFRNVVNHFGNDITLEYIKVQEVKVREHITLIRDYNILEDNVIYSKVLP